ATLAALQAHPEQTLIIAELALEDYRQARQAILNGDRERGGDPSPLLLALAQEQLAPPVQAEAEGVSLAQVQAVLQEVEAELQAEKLDRPPPRVPGPAQPSSPDPVLLPPMIRVEVQHLEQLSQVLGELLVDHNQYRQTQQHTQQQIRETLVLLEQAQAQLEQVRDWIRRDPGRSAPAPFDALELDAYGELHGAVESLGEALGQMEERLRAWQGQQTGLELKRRKRLLDQAQGALLQMRMVPVGTVLQRFFRVLEQLQVAHGKAVQLTVRGSELLVDKSLVEKLYDPLLHLVRNAFDHGIEPASERQKQGKPPTGRISIAACRQGNRTLIEVSDDGKGLDWERIRQRAIQRGLLNPEIQPSQEQLQEFLFQPGFSTVAQVNQLSGRGVGLNVVRSQIQSLQGSITIRSQPGQGTTFRLHLPLTLSTERLLICRCNGIPYALLTDGIVQLIIPEQIQHYQGFAGEQQAISWGEGWLPIRTLGSPVAPARSPLILLGSQEPVVALAVDEIVAEQDLVVKPLPPRPTPPPYALGYSFLSEGQLCLVVDPQVWLGSSPPAPPPSLPPSVGSRPWVLVVDDSLTQRVSLSQMLADAGYRVLQAGDGLEALQLCQEHRDLSLILCDIEMPQMNGFEFLQARQQNPKLQGIPVVMVTSRAGQKHRDYAVRLGADGYLIKPVVAAELWQILSQLGVVV
ncbi:MAG: response regulator, partial [Thermostichales cyanobacterium BF4_bins_65]